MTDVTHDCILVGGGLQNGLIALALRSRVPQARITLVEQNPKLGGNHTWCFHAGDLSASAREWIAPLVVRSWAGYRVIFPGLMRDIDGGYSAITSERFHEVITSSVAGTAGSEVITGTAVTRVGENDVELEGGRRLAARLVVDARGPASDRTPASTGFQKFLGLEVNLKSPHGLDRPIVMDATVDQSDGFRFFYCLPMDEDRLLLEDTYFNESPDLDYPRIRDEVLRYAASKGYEVTGVVREETGVLPMPWDGSLPGADDRPVRAGYAGGWFHPATGYSLPIAARLADQLAEAGSDGFDTGRLGRLARSHRRQARYCHLLNRFLFRWYPSPMRWHIFERFYRLPLATIDRFYALRMTRADRFRLLAGRPPRGLSLRYRMARRTV